MQAVILAAGMGKRLGELTKNNFNRACFNSTVFFTPDADHYCNRV